MNELISKFYEKINEGVAIADAIRENYSNDMICIKEVQAATSKFAVENELPKLVGKILEKCPEKRFELQRRIIAFMGEGKRLEDSLIR